MVATGRRNEETANTYGGKRKLANDGVAVSMYVRKPSPVLTIQRTEPRINAGIVNITFFRKHAQCPQILERKMSLRDSVPEYFLS